MKSQRSAGHAAGCCRMAVEAGSAPPVTGSTATPLHQVTSSPKSSRRRIDARGAGRAPAEARRHGRLPPRLYSGAIVDPEVLSGDAVEVSRPFDDGQLVDALIGVKDVPPISQR